MVNVEIITVGNEILLGLVEDANSNYLCRVVRGMGGRVCHITIVRDEIDSIAEDLNASISRRPDLIFTCGGLGPTDDDLTLAAVAAAVGRQLVLDTAARGFVERKYRELASAGYVASPKMTDERLKMARLPEGARAIENTLGAAPAVVVEARGSRIVSLPGVPAELKAIVEGPLRDLLGEIFGRGCYREREIMVECNDESQLAPTLRQVAASNPDVYIKSRATRFGPDVRFRVILSASATSTEKADALIEQASADLAGALRSLLPQA